jgi:hypothetical protein
MNLAESRARLRALLVLPDPDEPAPGAFPRSLITQLAISLLPALPRIFTLFVRRRRSQSPWPLLAQSVLQAVGARLR